ncbi:MAG: sialidase family protein [Promethearchaeota archaeon]
MSKKSQLSDSRNDSEPFFKETFIYEKIEMPGFPFAHCSNITELNERELMAQWYAGKAEQSKNQSIFAAKFDRTEEKWGKPFLLSKNTEYPEGNGVLWKDFKTNRLFFFFAIMWTHSFIKKSFGRGWRHCKLFYRISEDDGRSWSDMKTLKEETGFMIRNKPIKVSKVDENGAEINRIILPMYREVPSNSFMGLSDDDGETFYFSDFIKDHERYPQKSGRFISTGNSQPTITELDDDTILALFRTGGHKKIFRAISHDYGKTWTKAEEINLPNPDSGIDMVKLKSGAILLLFNNAASGRHNLSLATNIDPKGKKWKILKTIEDNPHMKFSYPAIIQTSDGLIHATYTYNRKTIKHIYFNEKWAFSQSEGEIK